MDRASAASVRGSADYGVMNSDLVYGPDNRDQGSAQTHSSGGFAGVGSTGLGNGNTSDSDVL